MTDIDLDAIEARANAATDGPWVVKHEPAWEADNVQHPDVITVGAQMWEADDEPMTVCLVSTDHEDDPVDVLLDAEFIAHARTDVPALVAEVRRLWEALDDGYAAIALAGAEIERASVEVDRAHRALLASNAERDDARAAIARVRALHSADDEYEEPTCHHCRCKTCGARHIPHPCPTIRALDGGDA